MNWLVISWPGTIMTFSLIAGADYGISASGSTALWIAMPIATDFFHRDFFNENRRVFEMQDSTDTKIKEPRIDLSVTPQPIENYLVLGRIFLYHCIGSFTLFSILTMTIPTE